MPTNLNNNSDKIVHIHPETAAFVMFMATHGAETWTYRKAECKRLLFFETLQTGMTHAVRQLKEPMLIYSKKWEDGNYLAS